MGVDAGPADNVAEEQLDRIVTIPNAISVVRLSCIPLFLWLLFVRDDRANAAWLLVGLGATDWIDGYIARRWNQVSTVGKVLDPTADRLLFIVGITAIIIDGSAPLWFSLAVLLREVILSVTLLVLTAMGMSRFDVSWHGKAGTFLLMGAFPSFLMSHSGEGMRQFWTAVAWLVGAPGLALSYYAAFTYIPIMRRSLAEGRAARKAST
jgi:cardiolipin synthase